MIRSQTVKNRINPYTTPFQTDSYTGRTPATNGKAISHNTAALNNELSNHQPYITERFSIFREGEDGEAVRKRILQQGIELKSKKHLVKECSSKLNLSEEDLVIAFKKIKLPMKC